MKEDLIINVKDFIKYALFLVAIGSSIASVTWTIATRPDRSEVRETIKDAMDPIHKQLTRIETLLDNQKK